MNTQYVVRDTRSNQFLSTNCPVKGPTWVNRQEEAKHFPFSTTAILATMELTPEVLVVEPTK